MKRQMLAVLAALFLLVGLVGCSSDNASSDEDDKEQDASASAPSEDDDTTTTEKDDDEATDAEAALEKIESNLGISKKDPDDDTDTTDDDSDTTVDDELTSGLTDDEAECVVEALEDDPDLIDVADDLDSADPEDQALLLQTFYGCLGDDSREILFASFEESFGFDLSAEEADCMFTSLISDPLSVSFLLAGGEPTDEQMAFAVGVVFGCLSPETQQTVFTEAFASSGLPADQIDCLAAALATDSDLLALIIALGIDPTTEIDAASMQALTELFAGCGVDPGAL